jgi:methionine synthase II (cobalamin-independent)
MEAVLPRPDFRAIPTVVGSFPHTDPRLLTERILARFAGMPAWPQMPATDWRESMYVQYSEGLPGAVLDPREQRIHFLGGDALFAEIEPFYQALIDDDVERFAITAKYARGLACFLESVPRLDPRPRWVKGQVTGPFSFAMTVTDQHKRSLAYDPDLYEVAVQGMAMKARWMARRLRQVAEGALVTLDEPYLCSFGSAFVNVPRGDVIAAIAGAVQAIHKEGALAGLHCCGNTDWSLVLATGLDVINFDAYEYFQGLTLYPEELRAFLAEGGILSWGIVPASRACADLDAHALLEALDDRIGQLVAKGMDRGMLYRQSLLTPSCGLATETEERADRAIDVLIELSNLVREREGLG